MSGQRYLKPGAVERIFGRLLTFFIRIGLVRGHFYVLEVRGRKSGRTFSLPVDPIEFNGHRYLVCARGDSNWVRNAGIASEVALVRAMRRRQYAVRELPPGIRPPVLKAYLDRFAGEVQRFFPVPKGSRWKHSTIWRRVTRSSSCSRSARPHPERKRLRREDMGEVERSAFLWWPRAKLGRSQRPDLDAI